MEGPPGSGPCSLRAGPRYGSPERSRDQSGDRSHPSAALASIVNVTTYARVGTRNRAGERDLLSQEPISGRRRAHRLRRDGDLLTREVGDETDGLRDQRLHRHRRCRAQAARIGVHDAARTDRLRRVTCTHCVADARGPRIATGVVCVHGERECPRRRGVDRGTVGERHTIDRSGTRSRRPGRRPP